MTLREEVIQLKERVAALQAEVRLLRRGRGRADEESMVALLELIHDAFGDTSWASGQLLETAFDRPVLLGAIVRAIGEKPSLQALGKFLMRMLGSWGALRLVCIRERTEYGALFRLTECVSASAEKPATVRNE